MTITWLELFADVPAAETDDDLTFWAAVTGGRRGEPEGHDGEFTALLVEGEDRFVFVQRVGRPASAGGWHLDLESDDRPAEVERAVAAGAAVRNADDAITVLTSPAGHPFCVLDAEGHARLPRPRTWPGGVRSRVDQICLDTPAADHGQEVTFWATFTGWPLADTGAPEFARLERPDHIPLRILLQRLGVDDQGGPRAHADLAASDVAAERRRHEALGAQVVLEAEHWTTLRDPAGLVYCITDRDPTTDS